MSFTNINIGFKILDDLPDMYFVLSETGLIIDANKSAVENFRIPDTRNNPVSFFDFITIIDRKASLESYNKAFKTGSACKIEVQLSKSENTLINADINFSFFEDSESGENLALAALHDVTEDKKKELELLRFYFVAQNTVNPLQITDKTGKMLYVNPAFEKASGYSKKELIGQFPSIFGSGKYSARFWGKMWDVITLGKIWTSEIENKKKNGEPFFTQLLISPIIDNEGAIVGYFGIHRDISEKKNLDKQLVHTQKMESIGTLAAGVAHEVGNPLASISALVQVAQRSTDDEFIIDRLELVKKQVTRISKIIRDLVDFSRPSNYELALTDINASLEEAIEIVKVGKKAKNINFIIELDDSIPQLPLVADQIQQVFVNILINAVDAISEDSNSKYKAIKEISVATSKNDENVFITFKDTGMGIQNDNLTKIFEPFYTTKKEGKGTGLGLWVSYGIIKSFQGEILVRSKEEKGTTFIILIPSNP